MFFRASDRSRPGIILTAVLVGVACLGAKGKGEERSRTYVAYPGPARTPSEVATLHLGDVDWVQVGSERIRKDKYRSIELAAGVHELLWGRAFIVDQLLRKSLVHDFRAAVQMEGGHEYTIHGDRQMDPGHSYRVFFWVEDVEQGTIVAGRKPASRMTPDQRKRARIPTQKDREHFFEAVDAEDFTTIKTMLDAGVDIEIRNQWDQTALMIAAGENRISLLRFLFEVGANPNTETYGATALMVASVMGHVESVQLLLEHDSTDINARTTKDQTALMLAAEAGKAGTVRLLLEAGSDVHLEDNKGKTALDLAKGKKVKSLLRDATTSNSRAN